MNILMRILRVMLQNEKINVFIGLKESRKHL